MHEGFAAPDAHTYAQQCGTERPRLLAYARTLTDDRLLAADLVAEAGYRVWRRLRDGQTVTDVPAALTAAVRDLAPAAERDAAPEPPQRVAYVALLARLLGRLPQRWVKALWLAEVENQPLDAVGRAVGAGRGAAVTLLQRAREGLRQSFLGAQPGAPAAPACREYWDRLPAHVRGADQPRQAELVALHADGCADCQARTAALVRAADQFPALLGPALLALSAEDTAAYLAVPAEAAGGSRRGAHAAPRSGAPAATR
ncbi:hypothetical protein RKE29_28665, partial [Streptomyces sp. B1866]|uniref:zf-HC2 domain-containing protein n=1 Tax=Streptomyces sp. B1866 TaxID=3075431 RepID=UPI0028927849|nr:hypothetical protein [Streptomyces sp. B1866]